MTASSTPTASGPGSGAGVGRPSPSPTPESATPALRKFCRKYAHGTLRVGSGGYRALVAAAGSPEAIPAYCASIVPPAGDDQQ